MKSVLKSLRKSNKDRSANKKRMIIRGSSAVLANARKIPTMRNHMRKNKKIPGSVRKPTNDKVVLLES